AHGTVAAEESRRRKVDFFRLAQNTPGVRIVRRNEEDIGLGLCNFFKAIAEVFLTVRKTNVGDGGASSFAECSGERSAKRLPVWILAVEDGCFLQRQLLQGEFCLVCTLSAVWR